MMSETITHKFNLYKFSLFPVSFIDEDERAIIVLYNAHFSFLDKSLTYRFVHVIDLHVVDVHKASFEIRAYGVTFAYCVDF